LVHLREPTVFSFSALFEKTDYYFSSLGFCPDLSGQKKDVIVHSFRDQGSKGKTENGLFGCF